MVDGLAYRTVSVVDGLDQGTSIVVVYVCALKIRKVIDSLLGEDEYYISDRDASMEVELASCCNYTIFTC